MNHADYRAAMDAVPLRPAFQRETEALLREEQRRLEEQEKNMPIKTVRRSTLLAAALAALLTVSAVAAAVWLTPSQVADQVREPLLAAAFDSADAITVNETVETGDYRVTLLGLVTGKDLSVWNPDAEAAHTYAVLTLRRTDGTSLDETFDFAGHTLTPLVAGFALREVNNWTLGSFAQGFARDGAYYYLLDTQDLEMFADHTVYLAFYEGSDVPSPDRFDAAEDGTIRFREDVEGAHALFTLPLDPDRADPAAVEAFLGQ